MGVTCTEKTQHNYNVSSCGEFPSYVTVVARYRTLPDGQLPSTNHRVLLYSLVPVPIVSKPKESFYLYRYVYPSCYRLRNKTVHTSQVTDPSRMYSVLEHQCRSIVLVPLLAKSAQVTTKGLLSEESSVLAPTLSLSPVLPTSNRGLFKLLRGLLLIVRLPRR